MANNILEKVNIEKTAKNIKKTVKNLNKEAIKTSENLVEGAIKNGHEWNKVLEKAAKNGTVLFGKQQDIMFDVLEGIKAQYFTGSKRFSKLIGFPAFSKKITEATQEVTETIKEKVTETRESIDEAFENVMDSDIVKKANEVIGASTQSVKKATKKASAKSDIKKDDLKVIEGVGPKMATILNDAGIKTFKQLANAKVTTLKEILAAAGPRYNMHNPTSWGKQAKLAAAGRMAELKKLQKELKAAKSAK